MNVILWIIPALLVFRLLEVYKIRNATLRVQHHIKFLMGELDILVDRERVASNNIAVEFLRTILSHAIDEIDTLSIWSMLYASKKYESKIQSSSEYPAIQAQRQDINEAFLLYPELNRIHKEFLSVSSFYIMDKSSVIRLMCKIGKVTKACSNAIAVTLSFKPLHYINRKINKELDNQLYPNGW